MMSGIMPKAESDAVYPRRRIRSVYLKNCDTLEYEEKIKSLRICNSKIKRKIEKTVIKYIYREHIYESLPY